MHKPFDWEEIENFLKEILSKSKHILTFGTIGSCNVDKDIDVMITKKPSSSSSDFYREVHRLFDLLEDYMKSNYNYALLRFPGGWQSELVNLSKTKEKALIIESMIYTSFSQIKADWEWAMLPNERIVELLKLQNFLLGCFSELNSREFKLQKYFDSVFICLYHYDRIHSGYSRKILLEVMNKHYDYLYRKRLGLKTSICKNKGDIRKRFYELCDILDKMEIKRKV